MRKFEIWEDGTRFATIQARSGVSALRKAARDFPRRPSDYNLEPGEKFTVVWRACEPGERWDASADISVPGRSDYGCSFWRREWLFSNSSH